MRLSYELFRQEQAKYAAQPRPRSARESIVDPGPTACRIDQPGLFEDLEMVRDGGLQQRQAFREVAHADFSLRTDQGDKDAQAIGIGEHFEYAGLFGEVVVADVGRRETAVLHPPTVPNISKFVNIVAAFLKQP